MFVYRLEEVLLCFSRTNNSGGGDDIDDDDK